MTADRNTQDWLGETEGQHRPELGYQPQPAAGSTSRRRIKGAGLLAAGLVAGGVMVGAVGASAASTSSSTPTSYSSSASIGTSTESRPAGPANHGPAPVRSDEKSLSASLTSALTTKAKAAVPGGTVYRVESDSGDATYEAHVTKSDGTEVTVKFDKNLAVTGVETGMGK